MAKHVIEIIITPEGEIKSEVQGVSGPSCEGLSAWLNELGEVTSDSKTKDWHKPSLQVLVGKAGAAR